MSDKARERAEFEEKFPLPELCEWNGNMDAYCWKSMNACHPHAGMFEAWLAAKEKYEPKWIDARKSTPEEDGDVLCLLAETDAVVVAFSFNSFFVNNDVECDLLPVTHWMPLPPAPSTQGGGE